MQFARFREKGRKNGGGASDDRLRIRFSKYRERNERFVHCGTFLFETGKDFEQSVDVIFRKSIDNREEMWYNTDLVRTANARPSPYRAKLKGAV